ncbi:MAG: hypothetical protein KDE28_18860, partial [Anaerolineales bacterium]|nr:hypothetical protein [Anaerolineales bacterium]
MKGSSHSQQFLLEFRQALRHLDDPRWLGANSLLASPYILVHSGDIGADPESRGQALQRLLRESMADLWPGTLPASKTGLMAEALRERENQAAGPRFQYLLLDVRYFRRYHIRGDFPARTKAMPGYLYLKESQFYDHLKTAVATLAELFRKRIAPTFRLETPLVPGAYVGRSAERATLKAELLANKMVGLRGMAGIGKSSLAAIVSMDWPDSLRFWYTFRPGLNDSSQALLFSLGYFLSQTVNSALWSHMLVRKDLPVEFPLVLGLLRSDLEKMPEQRPLLCFDEYDRLFTVEGEPASDDYSEIFELLDALRGLTPVLIIGQRLHHDIDSSFRLDPLGLAETTALVRRLQPDLRDEEVKEIYHWAGGNPRYLELVSHLLRYGDSLAELRNGEKIVATKPLLKRLWRRLTDGERELLILLSVFRTAAPTDAWDAQRHVLASLLQRDLIRADLSGSLQIQPPFGEQILEDLQPGVRRQAHLFAATLLAKRGEYTEAAFHFWQAGDPNTALSLWYPHQDQEIERGQTVTAHQIFRHFSPQDVASKMQGYLMQIQNRLLLMRGEARNVSQSAPASAGMALEEELE